MNDKSRTGVGAPQPISEILDGVSIPFAYKFGYLVNSYREPSFRSIESKLGLTRPEILSLIFLYYRDGISASDICDFSGHLKNNISRAVTALEKKKLIRRETDKDDQRRQIIFITAFTTLMHAVTSQTVDILLALLLIIGGVIGAQIGTRVAVRLKAEQLRILLSLLVLAVSLKIALDLLIQPSELYSVIPGMLP